MPPRTASTRDGKSCDSGISNRMPASRILAFTRTSRWLIVAGATRKAEAIVAASRPSTVCSINGVRAASSIAGWAQTKRSLGLIGHADPWPRLERGEERVAEGVFSGRHVAPRRGQVGEEPAASDHPPGLGGGLRVGAVGAPVGVFSFFVGAGGEVGRVLVDQDGVFHEFPSLAFMTRARGAFRRGGRFCSPADVARDRPGR